METTIRVNLTVISSIMFFRSFFVCCTPFISFRIHAKATHAQIMPGVRLDSRLKDTNVLVRQDTREITVKQVPLHSTLELIVRYR